MSLLFKGFAPVQFILIRHEKWIRRFMGLVKIPLFQLAMTPIVSS